MFSIVELGQILKFELSSDELLNPYQANLTFSNSDSDLFRLPDDHITVLESSIEVMRGHSNNTFLALF